MSYQTDKEEDRKGGGVPPWMTGSAKVGSGLSSGGAGQAGGMLARLGALLAAPKAIVAITVLGGMALGVGVVSTIQAPKQPSLAQRFNKEKVQMGAASNLPGSEQPGQSALNMAQSANSGFYGDPNASAQAPAAGAADAPADTPSDPAIDAAGAGAVAGGQAGAAGGSADEMAAALTGKQNTKAGMGGKFGKLSAGLGGGGLSGGAGLSGGIGGSFKQNLTNSRTGEARAFQGSNRAQVSRSKLGSNNLGKSALKGATAKRLDNMNRAMASRTGGAEAGAATHAAQWDAATPSGGAITGAGANGIAGGGQFSGDEGVGGGGPVDQNSTSNPNTTNDAPDTGAGKDVTPYGQQLMMAQGLLMLASAVIIVVNILSNLANSPFTAALKGVAAMLYGVAMAMAAAAMVIGTMVATKYGQKSQGTIVAVGGAATVAAGAMAMAGTQYVPSWVVTLTAIAGLAAGVGSLLVK